MRQIGTLPDGRSARAVADYLAGLSIEARLVESPGGWELWVCDEDKLPRAREEYQAFLNNPADERFRPTGPSLAEVPKGEAYTVLVSAAISGRTGPSLAEVPKEKPAARPVRRPVNEPGRQLTILLIAASILITVLHTAPDEKQFVYKYLFITEIHLIGDKLWDATLPELRRGELWRLITPIFIHFTAVHILFNMLWLFALGGQLEMRYGSVRLALLVILIAILSNVCQYFFSTITLEGGKLVVAPYPVGGGMSGVVYGLFGFVWIKAVYEPSCGLTISPANILLMLIWLIVCMTGAVGRIGNTAHLVGLAVGMLSGYVSAWWNGFGTVRHPPEPQE